MNIKNLVVVLLFIALVGVASAQEVTDDKPLVTIFPHPEGRFWISGQANFILQGHGGFPALYSGPNSLKNTSEHVLSRVFTLYTGVEVRRGTEVLFDVESTGGRGISDALGLAGFTNVDVVRNPDLGPKPYIARIMVHQTIALSGSESEQERNPFSISKAVPAKRLEIRIGKFGTADFFDTNSVGSDGHLQFTNWTVVNNGAYDYAADTRGYTYGAILEYQQPQFGVRFGEMLMPKVANGTDLDWDLGRAHAENLEFEIRPSILGWQKTTIRALSYFNTANMGNYREAVAAFLRGVDSKPDITAHRHQGSLKYGVGLNIEQTLPANFRAFVRAGWNEGRHESFAYTEANNTGLAGIDLAGEQWHRKLDKIGSAFVSNGLSNDHAEYLRLGGQGFLLGDGTLRYRREDIWELYYTAHIWRGVFASAQVQFISNPGYNQDRGPVWVPGARMHIDF
jgi:high affinity Mn2+ porin